jgi:hypothetical protein
MTNPDKLLSAFAFLNRRPSKRNDSLDIGATVRRTDTIAGVGTITSISNSIALVRLFSAKQDDFVCVHIDDLELTDVKNSPEDLFKASSSFYKGQQRYDF